MQGRFVIAKRRKVISAAGHVSPAYRSPHLGTNSSWSNYPETQGFDTDIDDLIHSEVSDECLGRLRANFGLWAPLTDQPSEQLFHR